MEVVAGGRDVEEGRWAEVGEDLTEKLSGKREEGWRFGSSGVVGMA